MYPPYFWLTKGHREPESGLGKRADAATRSSRVLNLPQTTHDASTTEGLLQQAFEKHAPVKRLEVFADKREAIVEFETAAVCPNSALSS